MKSIVGLAIGVSAILPGGAMDPEAIKKMFPEEIMSAPNCRTAEDIMACPTGEVPVQNFYNQTTIQHYGVDVGKILDSVGLDQLNMYSMGMLKNTKLDDCAAKVAACYATCGMDMKTCFDRFETCANKACKNDHGMFCTPLRFAAGFLKDFPGTLSEGQNFQTARCQNYESQQQKHCKCVPEDNKRAEIEEAIVQVYKKVGEGKEVEGENREKKLEPIRERWLDKGDEKDVFSALFTKYSKRLVRIMKRPKFNIAALPGVREAVQSPMVQMALQTAGIDLKDFGLDFGDAAAPSPEDDDEVDDGEL